MKIKLSSLIIFIFTFIHAEQYLDAINIRVYPEYYYKSVMVEMEAIIVADSESETISITLPSIADSVFFISGIPSPDSEVIPLTILEDGSHSKVEFSAKDTQFRLFVFYNPFDSGHEKNLTWPTGSNVAMKNVHLSVQVPVMAEQFELSRKVSSEDTDQHGILFKSVHLGDIPANEVEMIEASYFNASGQTTMEALRAQLSQPKAQSSQPIVDHDKPKRHTLLLWEPLAILGVLSIIIGIMYYSSNKEVSHEKGNKNFCSGCGIKLKDNDKFCSNCGEKVL
ncbi:MAG: zinc ribbon domain-containing protein [Candidatus Marinimicrobia bacterium]|jgi:hypothetical protein|nr:hypothetical protein [Candidatus Neomarinimicrobiota bacterium]MDP6499511.1 zinc ribbon domain-containing protein [Candidatus Neomarinimicrobiota bacterium]MDP6726961.1 zinc ribbon domain-containing protein [Candidatus Neomarinimicrobiota bacterium]|tara:strand:+ start:9764 stop:10606 length:843 start_codon:yes stop_codon:yes gene_type:complete